MCLVLAPWHMCSQNPGFSQNGCAKEPAQYEHAETREPARGGDAEVKKQKIK